MKLSVLIILYGEWLLFDFDLFSIKYIFNGAYLWLNTKQPTNRVAKFLAEYLN